MGTGPEEVVAACLEGGRRLCLRIEEHHLQTCPNVPAQDRAPPQQTAIADVIEIERLEVQPAAEHGHTRLAEGRAKLVALSCQETVVDSQLRIAGTETEGTDLDQGRDSGVEVRIAKRDRPGG